MDKKQTYDNCKYYSYRKYPHANEEIMKRATQDVPGYEGGNIPLADYPSDDEINEICSKCTSFSPK